ncbi:hypothetical protein P5V47_20520 [Mycobacteroides abscessus subsp. massiliense]|uniref:hypothetical protein n=1 Tax=Mycobacteroides abscessus TaxID=36809 RepID=UPI00266B3C58|nr:hypothetical protein [Mycobacteroides abscessus]MDO3301079.1 hypothetical protein [Mycobacteroides abscessus subsp. massiliense]
MSERYDERLAALRGTDLSAMHRAGSCPDPQALTGVAEGLVLGASGYSSLLWRGKVFDRESDEAVTGLNRIGVGGLEFRRYRFTVRLGASAFTDRTVALLDHDNPANPPYIRRFHDELVQIDEHLYLATSHYRLGGRLRFVCHFGLSCQNAAGRLHE